MRLRGAIDPTDPVVVRFIERVGRLTPSARHVIDARIDTIAASWPREPTPPEVERTAGEILVVRAPSPDDCVGP